MAGGGGFGGSGDIRYVIVEVPDGNVNQGRLTVIPGQPIPVHVDGSGLPVQGRAIDKSDTLYYTPYKGNKISLFKNGLWKLFSFSEISISSAGLGDSADGTVGPYDVYAYADDSDNVKLEFSSAWGSFLSRAVPVAYQNGIAVKSGDSTRKLIGTVAVVSVGLHTPPFLFWSGTNVRYVSNLYNEVDLHGLGLEGWPDDDTLATFELLTVSGWQIPVFIGTTVNGYAYVGHPAPSGDAIYANWVLCEPRKVRVAAKVKMLNEGSNVYGAGIGINSGDDQYDITKIFVSTETAGDTLEDEVITEFLCPPGLFCSYLSFFVDSGTQKAQVVVSDIKRGLPDDAILTYTKLSIAG